MSEKLKRVEVGAYDRLGCHELVISDRECFH